MRKRTACVLDVSCISYGRGWAPGGSRLLVNGGPVSEHAIDEAYSTASHGYSFSAGAGGHSVTLQFTGVSGKNRMHYASICLLGAKR